MRGTRIVIWASTGLACWLFGLLFCLSAAAASIVDSTGRTVDLPASVAHVIPAGVPAQVLLHALAPDKLAGLVEPFTPDHAIYVDETLTSLPQIPVLTRTNAPGDVAAVAALKPTLVLDYGSTGERYIAATEAIQAELKTPALLFSGNLDRAAEIVRELGRAFGSAERGDALGRTIAQALATVAPLAKLSEAERVPVYMARGSDGLQAMRAGSIFDEAIRLAGGRLVTGAEAGSGNDGAGAFRTMSVEQVVAALPAVVIVAESEATHGALRAALPKETRFVFDAGEPYKVLTGPPSLNRIAGVLALAAILHPTLVTLESEAAARVETTLFPIPPGIAEPSPLQLR